MKKNLNLKFRRIEAGLTQRALAMHIGCSEKTISNYENGAKPSRELAVKITRALGAGSPTDLFPRYWTE